MFDLVVGVEQYPEFLPWCLASRIRNRQPHCFDADMVIGFKMVRERFGSHVDFERPHRIDVSPTAGPFRRMANNWRFQDRDEGGCLIDFHVDFKFRSRLLDKLMGILFYEAVRRMVSAFEARAHAVYDSA
jgi:coenzyme Q-binding protein COQ10